MTYTVRVMLASEIECCEERQVAASEMWAYIQELQRRYGCSVIVEEEGGVVEITVYNSWIE